MSACAADSATEVEREVRGVVKSGLPGEQAKLALQKAGFGCEAPRSTGDGVAGMACSRTRSHHILSSCVQQVFLTLSRERVAGIAVEKPNCTGL